MVSQGPGILDEKFIKPTPDFNPDDFDPVSQEALEVEAQRRRHLGTSFFLNFDPLCRTHQIRGENGDRMRMEIMGKLRCRFISILTDFFPDKPLLRDYLKSCLEVALCQDGEIYFNNGEVYLWLKGVLLKEELVWAILFRLKESLEREPIVVNVVEHPELYFPGTLPGIRSKVIFYGWGFRYY